MARGWESKDIQSQQELAEERRAKAPQRSAEELAREAARNSLVLDRTRIQREIANARHPRHRQQLAEALRFIEERLAEIDPNSVS